MSEYSRPLGDTVKKARKKMGLTQNQVASIIGADERTIMNIETYKANTTMEVLYPLMVTCRCDNLGDAFVGFENSSKSKPAIFFC